MRLVLVALAVLAGALPAAAADVHPRSLALHQSDVPRGFAIDRAKTGVRTNAREVQGNPELEAVFARVGRMTGYSTEFRRGKAFIGSRVDVLRRPAGARQLLAWYDREIRKGGIGGLKRSRARLGAESWMYWEESARLTLVGWRYGRVFAAVLGTDLTKEQTLALARVQQQRMVAALG